MVISFPSSFSILSGNLGVQRMPPYSLAYSAFPNSCQKSYC